MEGPRKLKIGRKEAWVIRDLILKSKGQRSLDQLTPWPKISQVFGTGRPTNFKLGMKFHDPHHRHLRWSPSWKLWVAV